MLRLGQLVQSNENLTGEAWFKTADSIGYDVNEVQIPSGAIGIVAGVYEKYNRVLVELDSGARLDFEHYSCFDVVEPFNGFNSKDWCFCLSKTPGNALWNFISCFELYTYAGKMLNYFYGIMCREVFGDEYK